jgi:hypothetical protein
MTKENAGLRASQSPASSDAPPSTPHDAAEYPSRNTEPCGHDWKLVHWSGSTHIEIEWCRSCGALSVHYDDEAQNGR